MRFGLVHRVMTDALAVLGVLAVVSTATLGPWTTGLLLVGLVISLLIPESIQGRPVMRHFATTAGLVLFVVQITRVVLGQSLLDVAVEFAAIIQVIRIASRRGAVHDQQIIVLALLHLVAGTVLGGGLAYGICFLGFLVVAPGALVLSHLRREVEGNYRQGARDRTGLPVDVPRILRSRRVVGRGFLLVTCLLSVPIFLFTATLFVLFPRVGLSLLLLSHPRTGKLVGFSDHVDLGQVGVLRTDPSIALRFELPTSDPPPPRMTLRLRGTAFDSYDGRAWSRTPIERRPAERAGLELYPIVRMPDPSKDKRIAFDLEPIDPPVVFLPPKTIALHVKVQNPAVMSEPLILQHGPEGEIRYTGADAHGLRYEAYLAQDNEVIVEPLPGTERPRYLSMPPAFPARVGELAHQWTDMLTTQAAKAKAIEDHLRKDFHYDVGSPSSGTPQPVDHFLFESKRGHCEFFSTSMALMLRAIGIPSRNVTGFVGGTYNRFGKYYAVREGDAHSWVEAYIDDVPQAGWVTFDPTPPAGAQPLEETTGFFVYVRDIVEALSQRWNRYVVGYDIHTQVRMVEGFSRRYDSFRSSLGIKHGDALEKATRGPVLAGAATLFGILAYTLWKRRKKLLPSRGKRSPKNVDPTLEAASALYRGLETALFAHGIRRPASLTPLKHAESLREGAHPLAQEVGELTNLYLELRFGHTPLAPEITRDFERRVRAIRQTKLQSTSGRA